MKKIVLASASPRRKELLEQIGFKIDIMPSDVDENIEQNISPCEYAKKLSLMKAQDIAGKCIQKELSCIVIGADTIVVKDTILGKPKNREDAFDMLNKLSGTTHEVITGVTIIDALSGKYLNEAEITRVTMNDLTLDEINSYLDVGESFDKAGAYGIQGVGSVLVRKIEGCYFNVVGLPISRLTQMLKKFEVNVLKI